MSFLPSSRPATSAPMELVRTETSQSCPSRKQSLYLNRISGWLVRMLNFDKCWFSCSFSQSSLTYQQKHKTRSPTPVNSLLFLFTRIVKDLSSSPIQGIVVGYFGKGLFLKPMFVWFKKKKKVEEKGIVWQIWKKQWLRPLPVMWPCSNHCSSEPVSTMETPPVPCKWWSRWCTPASRKTGIFFKSSISYILWTEFQSQAIPWPYKEGVFHLWQRHKTTYWPRLKSGLQTQHFYPQCQ